MALTPGTRYSGQTDTSDPAYPLGKARNAGAFNDGTGTPLEKDWLNDDWGFKQALLDAAGLEASGDPDEVGASQYLEAIREVSNDATLGRNLTRALALRALDLGATTPVSNAHVHAVNIAPPIGRTLVAKGSTNGAFTIVDMPLAITIGTVTGITNLFGLVKGGGRILAHGDGTTKNAFSTNNGSAWTAGGASGLSFVPVNGVWDGTQFVLSTTNGKSSHSTNGVAWTTPSGNDIDDVLDTFDGGLAALASGNVVAAGSDGADNAFAITSNHGASWTLAGTIPSSDYPNFGYVAGNGGSEIYWLGKADGIERLDLWVSTDGATWTKRSELPGFTGLAAPTLRMCQDTGILLAQQLVSGYRAVSISHDRGFSWSGIVAYDVSDADAIAIANGRVFATNGAKLYATDRL